MSPARRWTVWIALLLGVVALVVFERNEQPQVGSIVEAVPARASARTSADAKPDISRDPPDPPMILAIRPRAAPGEVDDAFPVRDWTPAPPPLAAKSAPLPPPSAPPLPYTVFGKKLEDGEWQVFLRRDNRVLVVKSLDTIDGAYRVDEIRPPVMALTYLPLQQRQTLPIGGAE